MTYQRAFDQSRVERVVDPLGLVAKGATWYLVAAVDGEPRTYRASRLSDVEVLTEPAERPADFDLPTWWAGSREAFEARLPVYHVTVRVAPDALPRARWGWRFGRLEEEGAAEPDGWSTCRLRFDTEEVAADAVLGLGPSVVVVDPPELGARVLAAARALVARSG